MSFEENLEKQFEKFELTPRKWSKKLIHLYADYIELVALINNGDYATNTNIARRYKSEGIRLVKKETTIGDEIGSTKSDDDDKTELFVDSVFSVVTERSDAFNDAYPFIADSKGVKLKEDVLSYKKQCIYLMLLISSNLNYFEDVEDSLTKEFEHLSCKALLEFLPGKAIIRQFGKNSDYTGSAQQKINKLAVDLNASEIKEEIETVVQGNQERGLDVIGWIPFADKIPNMISIFVQCACGKDWFKKQHETSRYDEYYRFYRLKPIHTMFIPYALVKNNTEFYQRDDHASDRLLFERQRILEYIHNTDFYDSLNSARIISKCVEYGEGVA